MMGKIEPASVTLRGPTDVDNAPARWRGCTLAESLKNTMLSLKYMYILHVFCKQCRSESSVFHFANNWSQ